MSHELARGRHRLYRQQRPVRNGLPEVFVPLFARQCRRNVYAARDIHSGFVSSGSPSHPGIHFTTVLLHAVNAPCQPTAAGLAKDRAPLCRAMAIHLLRVESVAWSLNARTCFRLLLLADRRVLRSLIALRPDGVLHCIWLLGVFSAGLLQAGPGALPLALLGSTSGCWGERPGSAPPPRSTSL